MKPSRDGGNWSFPKQIAATLIISLALGAYPLLVYGTKEVIAGVISGALLGTLNIALGYAVVEYAFNKSMTTFTKVVIGGIGIRLVFLLGAMLVLIIPAGLHAAALMFSLFYFYIVYLVLEILFIQKKVLAKTSNDTAAHH